MKRLAFILSCLIAVVGVGNADARDAVVLDVEGQVDLVRGETVAAGSVLVLGPDSRVLLASANGEKVGVAGPFHGTVDLPAATTAEQRRLVATLTKLVTSVPTTAEELNRTRSFGGGVPDPWAYQIGGGTSYCFKDRNGLSLWRRTMNSTVPVRFSHRTGAVDLPWPAGTAVLGWPLELPRQDGETYELTVASSPRHGLRLVEIPAALPTRMHLAAWMTENGCPEQAMLLALTADVDRLFEGLGKAGKF